METNMCKQLSRPAAFSLLAATAFLISPAKSLAAGERFEKRFPVTGRPVLTIQNAANGRIEVKSSKNPEVVIAGSLSSANVVVETEQAGNRIGLTSSILDRNAAPAQLEANFDITVPEETELEI